MISHPFSRYRDQGCQSRDKLILSQVKGEGVAAILLAVYGEVEGFAWTATISRAIDNVRSSPYF